MISVVAATQATASYAPQLATSAARNGLPTICEWDYMARAGYGHDLRYGQRRAGEYVARILKGAAPAELPVEQFDAWKLTVNLKAAAQLGLTVPQVDTRPRRRGDRMRRCVAIAAMLLGAMLSAAAWAQQPQPMPRLGILAFSACPHQDPNDTLMKHLGELGYVEGRTIALVIE